MTRTATQRSSADPLRGNPAWEIAHLFPDQGDWTEEDYLRITRDTNCHVELTDGFVEVLRMPTSSHQRIVAFLFRVLDEFVRTHELGEVLFAVLRMYVRRNKFREPDILFMHKDHRDRAGDEYWRGADLVMEVVSPDEDSHQRDWVRKPRDYAEAGIPEYWIVDPQQKRVVVLQLRGDAYVTFCEAGQTGQVRSALLDGFAVDAEEVWAAMDA